MIPVTDGGAPVTSAACPVEVDVAAYGSCARGK
jgi:hypothetical protein